MESSLKYHQGCVKACIAINRKRIFFNTGVRITNRHLDSKLFVKKEAVPHWQKLNKQILSKKRQLDEAILKDMDVNGDIDLDRVHLILKGVDDLIEPEKPVEIDKRDVTLGTMLNIFRDHQPKMDRGLRWRYELLQSTIDANNLICHKITPKYVYEIIQAFIGNINANSAGTRYKNFKRFYNWAKEDEKYPLPKFEWKRYRPVGFKPDFVFLTEERIEQLIKFKPSSELLETVKDIFLVLIYTGMRYSDYQSLTEDECQNGVIEKTAQKTKARFKVPIHSRIAHIVKIKPLLDGQKFNRGAKDLGKEMGWTEMIRYQSDIDTFETLPFYEMLCSSVGRHTFATRCLLNNIPHNIIMSFCGWKSPSILFYYSATLKLDSNDFLQKLK